MEYFSKITDNEGVLVLVAVYAAIAWLASSAISIKSFLSKKHELELIKLMLEINSVHSSQFSGQPPYSIEEINSAIRSTKEYSQITKGMFWLGGHLSNLLYWVFTSLTYILGVALFLNIPMSLWFHEQITFLQGFTLFLCIVLLTAGFGQTAQFLKKLRNGLWQNA